MSRTRMVRWSIMGALLTRSPVGRQRQDHRECRAFARIAVDRHRPAVQADELAHDPEAQTVAARSLGGIAALEALEDMLPLARRDPGSAVGHGDPRRAVALVDRD